MATELDNLHKDADGEKDLNLNSENNQSGTEENKTEAQQPEDQKTDEPVVAEENQEVTNAASTAETENQEQPAEESPNIEEAQSETETVEEVTDENAAESTDLAETHEEEEEEVENVEELIPFKNYEGLPLAVLIGEAKELLKNHPARILKEHFNQIRDAVKKILEEDEAAKKEAFVESGGEELDFRYDNPARKEFNLMYSDYRNQLDLYFKEQEKEQQENLKERLAIIEELKSLYQDQNDDNSNIFNKFRNLKTRWHNAGRVPRAHAGNIYKTYFHHLDNFYLYLDLNKELREMDYAHNLEVRESIIKRAKELVNEENVQKALNELQYLHKLWKEEAVPVAEELKEKTWQEFKDLTLKIHERKSELNERIKEEQQKNLEKKNEILDKIKELYNEFQNKSHGDWQSNIRKLNKLREEFIAVGRVPKEVNQKLWDEFKSITREFNHKKNEFYKSLKSEQQENLDKKMNLLEIARQHAESSDWDKSVQVIKKIQSDWKKIGHVPRKQSDKIWKDFKDSCNKFFDNYKARDNRSSHEFSENLIKKEGLLSELNAFKLSGDKKADLEKINEFNIRWSSIGKVPAAKMAINTDFSKSLNELVKAIGLSEDEIQEFKMAALFDRIKSGQDENLLDDEIRKARKTIDELEKEINQLETNIGFFTDENSPLLKNVKKQIDEKRSRLSETEFRLRKLHRIDFNDDKTTEEKIEGNSETESAENQ